MRIRYTTLGSDRSPDHAWYVQLPGLKNNTLSFESFFFSVRSPEYTHVVRYSMPSFHSDHCLSISVPTPGDQRKCGGSWYYNSDELIPLRFGLILSPRRLFLLQVTCIDVWKCLILVVLSFIRIGNLAGAE